MSVVLALSILAPVTTGRRKDGAPGVTFSTRAAGRILAIAPHRIRYWLRRNLLSVSSQGRRYRLAFGDLLMLRMARELLPRRRSLKAVERCLGRARAAMPPALPMTAVRLSCEDGTIIVRDGALAFEAESGQLLLDFAPKREAGKLEEGFGAARLRERFEEARRLAEVDPVRALTLYARLLESEPQNYEAGVRLAELRQSQGDLHGALRSLLGAAAAAPTSADAHLRLGRLYRVRGETAEAILSLRRALECDSNLVEAHRMLAEIYQEMGRLHDAHRHWNTTHRPGGDLTT